MKVAILHSVPVHYKHLLFKSLSKLGVDFEVLYLASELGIRKEKIHLDQIEYKFRIGFTGDYESASPWTKSRFTWNSLCDIAPDVVVVSGYMVIESWAALLWAKLRRKRLVIWFESNQWDHPRHWYKELPKKFFVICCDQAQVYGRSSASYMAALGMNPSRIIGKRTVADTVLFGRPEGRHDYFPDGARRLVFVGRLAPEKNVSLLLRALSSANASPGASPMHLTIVGTGPLEAQLKGECRKLGLEGAVSFEGYKYQKELPEIFNRSDVFILPSSREPYGLVVIEAMLSRLPVVVSQVCGCAADVVNQETGWTFSPKSESELTQILIELSNIDAGKMREMGQAAYNVAKSYNPDASASIVADGLRSAAN